jgi:hypothetical protein
MINMMKDILQYLPYALFLGAIFLLLMIMVAVTVNHFRKGGKGRASFPASKGKSSLPFNVR